MKSLIGFAGFGGVEVALRNFGFDTIGIEIDRAIAEVNRYNGGNVITSDLLDVNPAEFAGFDLYHFSPPCPSFSIANHASSESELDIALARKICEFIRVGRPRYITLENVWMYRKSLSWALIREALLEEGYGVEEWHLNSADYGVPQNRKRMIVIARRDGQQTAKPWPTHQKQPDMFSEPWRGWYGAIEDLIPDLPETRFAAWQMKAMPDQILDSFLVPGDNTSNRVVKTKNQPMVTIQTRPPGRCPHRAFILGQGERSKPKAGHLPADTVTGNTNQAGVKAFTSGRIVPMTTRCLARFQDFPDSFVLPANKALACRGIGNALPPGLYRAVLKSLF